MEEDFNLLDGTEESKVTEEAPSVGDQELEALENTNEWAKGLDDTLRKDPTLHKFKDIGSLAKSYVELERTKGKSPFPTAKSTPEEIEAFYRKSGIPEAKDYKLDEKSFGLSEEVANELKELASKNGIPPQGLAEALKFFQGKHSKQMSDEEAKYKAQVASQVEALKKEYGSAFDKYKGLAKEVALEIFSKDELKALQASGLQKEPLFVKLLMDRAKTKYGEEMIEDDHTTKGLVATPQAIETRINEIMTDPAYFDNQAPKHNMLVKELEKLYLAKNKV